MSLDVKELDKNGLRYLRWAKGGAAVDVWVDDGITHT
jgi:hypothetical protein